MRATPSQTVGPFFHIGLPWEGGCELVAPDDPAAVVLGGSVFDGEGAAVGDALIELWQANAAGRYAHPRDDRDAITLQDEFHGFGRCHTDETGTYRFVTVKPGPVPFGEDGRMQAPHIAVSLFARGLLRRLVSRIYFPDEAAANERDPVLAAVEPERRSRLVAVADGDGLRFDIHLQGELETPFFDL